MYLVDYMNSHSNWVEELAGAPYYIKTKVSNDYYLLEYTMGISNFMLPEVAEARGSIFRRDGNKWICVCRSLDKFHNYLEPEAATAKIDWDAGVDIQQKIDGSICRIWNDRGEWHLSSNGVVDARNAECGDFNFYDIFFRVLGTDMKHFSENLNPDVCYWFELVSKNNRIVVRYDEEAIYYLGARNMRTMEEYSCTNKPFIAANLRFPKHYTYHSLYECVEVAHKMGDDEEGYVVVSTTKENGSYLRIKVKGEEYLRLHRMRGNGILSVKRIVEMWQSDMLDDYIGNFPEYHSFIKNVTDAIAALRTDMILAFDECRHLLPDRKEYAKAAFKYHPMVRSYLFARADNKCGSAYDYIKDMRLRTLSDYVASQLSVTEYGTEEEI